jgi:hypothetical protein
MEKETEIKKLTFKQLTRNILKDNFGLVQVRKHEVLNNWVELSKTQPISDFERQNLLFFQRTLENRSSSWNEFELSEWFIGPVISLIDYNTEQFTLFACRDISAIVNNFELSGRPDVIIAKGIDSPQIPYFCFHEYKQQTDPNGNPQTQLLGAMLAAQALNNNKNQVYGVYVIGYDWKFVILKGTEWIETSPYIAVNEVLFDIFRMLKALKEIILSYE